MKKILLIVLAVLTTSLLANNKPTGKSNKEIMAKIAMKRYGGKIRQANTEKGKILVVNRQSFVEASVLENIVKNLERQFRYIIEVSKEEQLSSPSCFVIRLEELDRKERVLLAPEDCWVSVNVKGLIADNPPKAVLRNRFEKEVRRAFSFVCGGTCGTEPNGLCRMVTELSDLDAIPGLDFALDVEARIVNNMNTSGIRPYRIAKYSEAVKEGWAPAPTNEYQKAIWDKVRSEKERGPTNPIEIPMPKKK